MKSRLLFRQSGMVIRTKSRFQQALWPACGVMFVLGIFSLGAFLDRDTERFAAAEQVALQLDAQHQAQLRDAYEAGRRLGRTEMVDSARTIWQAALDQGQQMCELHRMHRAMP